MVLVLEKGATKKEMEKIDKALYEEKPKGGFNAKKYNGIMPFLEDGMEAQKKLRNEWERDIS